MYLILNGSKKEIAEKTTIKELLLQMGLEPEKVVVEHNYNVAAKEYWDNTVLKDKDKLEILKFVGGG